MDTKLNNNKTLGEVYQGNYIVPMATLSSEEAAGFYTRQRKDQSNSDPYFCLYSNLFSLRVLHEHISFYIYNRIFYFLFPSLLDFPILSLLLLFSISDYSSTLLLLGALAKHRRATIRFIIYVCLSVSPH
jgi:hypothetical protein